MQSGECKAWVTSRGHYSVFSEDGGSVSLSSRHMSWSVPDSLQQCMTFGEYAVSCKEPSCVKGAALSCLVQAAALSGY